VATVECCFDKVERCFDNVACCFDTVAGVDGALVKVVFGSRSICVSGVVERSRDRRSPLSWLYEPRAIRQLTSPAIDAFNERLHSKRPKFIGKRRVPSPTPSCHLDAFGSCVPDDDGGVVDKRGAARKFMGKKSDYDDAAGDVELIQRATRARKFVGKRGWHRFKFGRSAGLDDEMRSVFDRQARRKFVG